TVKLRHRVSLSVSSATDELFVSTRRPLSSIACTSPWIADIRVQWISPPSALPITRITDTVRKILKIGSINANEATCILTVSQGRNVTTREGTIGRSLDDHFNTQNQTTASGRLAMLRSVRRSYPKH
ncbi:hypothetical protein Tcan_01416, partial [Toxocara canis]